MASLTGPEIIRQINLGRIVISPFDEKFVTSDGVDLHLGDTLLRYPPYRNRVTVDCGSASFALDSKRPPAHLDTVPMATHKDEKCWVLEPGVLYLGSTKERTACDEYVPRVAGRSSTGRLGISVHITAGEGDHGFNGHWTLEITCVERILLYPGQRLCQVRFAEIVGDRAPYGTHEISGNYQQQDGVPVPSRGIL